MVAILENGRHFEIFFWQTDFLNRASHTQILTAKSLKYIEQVLAFF